MKKIFYNLILFLLISIIIFLGLISTIGLETNKFNNFISKKINNYYEDLNLELSSIKFKIDIKELALFLETLNPKIDYKRAELPTENIKVYLDFKSFLKSEPKIKKINLTFRELNIKEIKKISSTLKPSNFKNLIQNYILEGKLNLEIEFYMDNKNLAENFIARGTVSNLKAKILNNIHLEKTNFKFFADNSDVLLSNISSKTEFFKIQDGDLKIEISSEILIQSNFKSEVKYKDEYFNKIKLSKYLKPLGNISNLHANLNNNFKINFDKTYKIQNYELKSNGKILNADLDIGKLDYNILGDKIKNLSFINSEINFNIKPKKKSTVLSGEYSLNKNEFENFSLNIHTINESINLKLNTNLKNPLELSFINYKKPKNTPANLNLDLIKKKELLTIKELKYSENETLILGKDIKFKKGNLFNLKKISVSTTQNKETNNDFSIVFGKKIFVKGSKFDANNLGKILNDKSENNLFSQINSDIEIEINRILAPVSEKLSDFRLIGKIEQGQFINISSKGDFGNGNFLDISMKNDKEKNNRYLEVYSDITKPLLSEFDFFKGLTGGKLLYSSTYNEKISYSKLKIEKFKVVNAPGMIKLLALADLRGLADLAAGDGLSFDTLEISMEKNNDNLKLSEILAIGPSISVLMEGYQNKSVTSLRGTLIPAKTLNKLISKIPVIGDIVIPKEVGEGLFGVSFKLKGPPGNIKTTINPIRTITPRFIQKIIDKSKNSK